MLQHNKKTYRNTKHACDDKYVFIINSNHLNIIKQGKLLLYFDLDNLQKIKISKWRKILILYYYQEPVTVGVAGKVVKAKLAFSNKESLLEALNILKSQGNKLLLV